MVVQNLQRKTSLYITKNQSFKTGGLSLEVYLTMPDKWPVSRGICAVPGHGRREPLVPLYIVITVVTVLRRYLSKLYYREFWGTKETLDKLSHSSL